jgi:asparagine synthase (glutamine-hydrolysing)
MSGIAGWIRFDGGPIEPERAERLLSGLAFGGADTHEIWINENVAFAASLRWTTSEAVGSSQPLLDADQQLALVFDGWLADPQALALELRGRGASPRTCDDAALVLAAYGAWGEACVDHFDGEFAFGVWDGARRRAFCARDRMGVRPFYYAWNERQFLFCTDVAPILAAAGRPFAANINAVADYLAGESPPDCETLWEGVLRLPAATRMVVDGDPPKPRRYWRPEQTPPLILKRERDYVAAYRDILFESVRRACRSRASVACEVSGGLDSSALYCVAHALDRRGALPAPGLLGYTLNFENDAGADEIAYARSVGRHCQTTIREVSPLTAGPGLVLDYVRRLREFPGFPSMFMAQPMYRAMADDGCRVVLNGLGGDEWLTGSRDDYAENLRHGRLRALMARLRLDAQSASGSEVALFLARDAVLPLLPSGARTVYRALRKFKRRLFRQAADNYGVYYWLSPAMRRLAEARREEDLRGADSLSSAHPGKRDRLASLHSRNIASGTENAVRFAAEFGLQSRIPMRSREMVEFAFATPEHLRLRGRTTKFAHRESLRGIMPEDVRLRPTKSDFAGIFISFLREMDPTISDRGRDWISASGFERLQREASESDEFGWPLWPLWGTILMTGMAL